MSYPAKYMKQTQDVASKLDCEEIEKMVQELVKLRERKGRLFILGVGGSAGNVSHAVNDFRIADPSY